MARGGFRPGAGRPRTKPASLLKDKAKNPAADGVARTVKSKTKMTPLEYMLAVMRDEAADEVRRDRMAIAAAAYVHERAADRKLGKKEQKLEAAKQAKDVFSGTRSMPQLVVNNN